MLGPDRSQEYASKLTSYLGRLYKERNYALLETSASLIAIAGSSWLIRNSESEIVKQALEQIAPVYLLATAGALSTGLYGLIDGGTKTFMAMKEIMNQEKEIRSKKYKIRGFWLNRTVVAV